jgi:glutamyl-tRNA synthetase
VMKSLRAALMGDLQGPDLIQSWLLLHQKGWDSIRLQQALSHI